MSVTDPHGDYGTIVVVGGGCYGSYYVRQLHRAAAAGALRAAQILVVDRDEACAVQRALRGEPAVPVATRLRLAEWRAFFNEYLDTAAREPQLHERDAIVPSPLMPHLMAEWLIGRARSRWPERTVTIEPLPAAPAVPWERAGGDGTHYLSFATWSCPINCIEPRICPHTRSDRDWSLPDWIGAHVAELGGPGVRSAVLHCTHRLYGVGMFDTRDVVAADQQIADAGGDSAADVVIGTTSHCHGALTRLVVGAPNMAPAGSGQR